MSQQQLLISGYQILEQIYESDNSLIYRGISEQNNQAVILKLLKHEYPTPAELTRYKQEYAITHSLDLEGVVTAYGQETYQNTLVIIIEDFGGESLQKMLNKRRESGLSAALSLIEFLPLAISITEVLGRVHAAHIIHKDINPANIVVNSHTRELKLIDFGIASQLNRENPTPKSPHVLEGTLAYISPEQTGRMNRSLDYRTDFYSLGVTFYELLTGQLPFATTDVMELIHCHIAKQPTQVDEINVEIPLMISQIVMKLMAKNAEERYQSAWGIQADLEYCLEQLENNGTIADFTLCARDVADKFQIPHKLYGRESQIASLLAAFERIAGQNQTNTKELVLVAGYSGMGKSALVNEIHKPITARRGYFISGKFEQFQRNMPYFAVVAAFRDLVRQLLSETEAQLNQWRAKILAAVGVNGQLIIDVIPEVALIIGEQPCVPELAPTESQNRFNLILQQFIGVFCAPEHPLVIFLDDLQWSDVASLRLLQLLLGDTQITNLLLIGAYRDNEVNPAHPLTMAIAQLREQETIINQINLMPLGLEHVNQLLRETVHHEREYVQPLAELVLHKTQGNPFFVNEFLQTLYGENLIKFELEHRSWRWDIEQIEAMNITDNVVELMIAKLQKLPQEVQQTLQLAACIGANFDLSTLAIVGESAIPKVAQNLQVALQAGLILPTAELDSQLLIHNYKFLHDRVQQAAYSLIDEEQKPALHLKIGQLLWQNTDSDHLSAAIFGIIDHLNLGIALLSESAQREEIAQLNLLAGKKAKHANAYEPAINYLKTGIALLADDSWENQYQLSLNLHIEAIEAEYLNTNFAAAKTLSEIVLEKAQTLGEKISVYEVEIQAYAAQREPLKAVELALQVLAQLEIRFPQQPTFDDIQQALKATQTSLAGTEVEALLDLGVMTEPNYLAAIKIMGCMLAPIMIVAPQLMPLVVLKMVDLSVNYGNTALSASAYATYGLILCGIVGDINCGYKFGQLALNLLERFDSQAVRAKTVARVIGGVLHWQQPLRQTWSALAENYQVALATGDLEYAAISAQVHSYYALFAGQELHQLEQEIGARSQAIKQLQWEIAYQWNQLFRQVSLNLRGEAQIPTQIIGSAYNEAMQLPMLHKANDRMGILYLYLCKLMLCYLFEEYEQAQENSRMAQQYLDAAPGMVFTPLFYFYDTLTKLAVYGNLTPAQQQLCQATITTNLAKLQTWGEYSPANYLHKFYLLQAEHSRVLGQYVEAIDLYDRAIAIAQENKYINEQALANELAAKCYQLWGKEKIAQVYQQQAYQCYQMWGAKAKVQALEQRYAKLAPLTTNQVSFSSLQNISPASTAITSSTSVDLTSVLKASQTLAQEIKLDTLLAKMMGIVIENAGATQGYLILRRENQWIIAASGTSSAIQVSLEQIISLEADSNEVIPLTIVNYVLRTQESLVLNDALNESRFAHDPYIKIHQCQSIVCLPLIHQGKLIAIIYLENNLTIAAFTPQRLEILQLLSSQAAISIENATLYNTLEQKVVERTEKLSQAIQDLKATQNKLIESEKMAALGSLVAGVAHEINTPVGTSITVASTLADETQAFQEVLQGGKLKRSALQSYLDTAQESTNLLLSNLKRAGELVQSFKQVAVDQANLEQRTINLKSYLAEILVSLEPKLKPTPHHITIEGHETITIQTYPGALAQIITNLLVNSLTHAYPAQQAGKLHWLLQHQGDRIILEYSDDGCGIAPQHLGKIFEPFFTTTRNQGGTGLGLHIVYNLVTQKLKGTIDVRSQVGMGTIFTMSLPLDITDEV